MSYKNVRSLDLIWQPDISLPDFTELPQTDVTAAETTSISVYSEDVAVHAEQTEGNNEVINAGAQPVSAALLFIPIFAAAVITAVIFAVSSTKKSDKTENAGE